MKLHWKALQAIAFHHGIKGAAELKARYPEAKDIMVQVTSLAYERKPSGYNDYLASLAGGWLDGERPVTATNAADIERLNLRFGRSFNPTNHFSETLTRARLASIKAQFTARGVPFDGRKITTMSKVKAAAKAARSLMKPSERFGSVGVIADGQLTINARSYPIVSNGQRRCIRITIGGSRRRLYLDELEWIAEWMDVGQTDPLSITNISIGELAYSASESPMSGVEAVEMSGSAYTGSLKERLRRLREASPHPAIGDAHETDPLCD